VLRRVLGPKEDEIIGCCRILHIEELPNLYSSPNIRVIGMVKSRKMRRAEHVARMGDLTYLGFCLEIQKEGDH
jgi:hypothetical protein